MNKYATQFSIAAGLQLQADGLNKWRRVLNDETFAALQRECIDCNSKLLIGPYSGYDVFRGDDLTQFVLNRMGISYKEDSE